jgi:transmembrane sensor
MADVDVGSSEINNRAAEWVVRLDRHGDAEAVRAEFDQWLSEDRRHQGAFIRAEAAWVGLDRAKVLAPSEAPTTLTRRRLVAAGAASGAAAAVAASAVFWIERTPETRYRTALGDLRRIKLEDGSVVSLNSDSELVVAMGRHTRRLRLVNGEAWFEVAKDQKRPFIVDAGQFEVKAVGTAFSICNGNRQGSVIVTEGVVELRRAANANPPIKLAAGSRALLEAGRLETQRISVSEMERILAWREGGIALAGETLAEAVVAFNRYNTRKLVIQDPRLRDARMVGWFKLDDPETFARAAALTLRADVRVQDDQIILADRGA